MLRATISALVTPSADASQKLLVISSPSVLQTRGRRRTLTPHPWIPPVFEKNRDVFISDENKQLLGRVLNVESGLQHSSDADVPASSEVEDISADTRRVGLIARKIGMLPQWTDKGDRILCTVLEVAENNVISVVSPDDWYRRSIIGKRKAFNRDGPMYKVTVGAFDGNPLRFTQTYRNQFVRAGVPVKQHLGSFLVTENAIPEVGIPLDIRHFNIGQYITASGKTIDWGFQGGMHRWGMRGQPARRTTKSHRRIGSVGSVGDARIWPGKRMPGHMGYEWVTVSGLQIIRMNIEKQVIYVKGSVPGDLGETLLLKDCLQSEKRVKSAAIPTWSPSLETISEESENETIPPELRVNEKFIPNLFRFTSPSLVFSDADAKKSTARDKTKAKIAKVKK